MASRTTGGNHAGAAVYLVATDDRVPLEGLRSRIAHTLQVTCVHPDNQDFVAAARKQPVGTRGATGEASRRPGVT